MDCTFECILSTRTRKGLIAEKSNCAFGYTAEMYIYKDTEQIKSRDNWLYLWEDSTHKGLEKD